MRIRSWVLALAALISIIAFNSCSNGNGGTTPGIGFLWVATKGDQLVSSFTVDLSDGAVSSVRSSVSSGSNPNALALTPDGATLFVANIDDNCGTAQTPSYCDRIRPFPINQTDGTIGTQGTAVQITSTTSSTPLGMALGLAIDPTGKFLFVTHQGNSGPIGSPSTIEGTISVFTISGTSLTAVGSPVVTTRPGDPIGTGPIAAAATTTPNVGGFLYVANQFSSTVSAYSYDSSGNLTFLTNYPVAANPSALAFSREVANTNRDNFLFVSNSGANQVSIFSACVVATLNCGGATGVLSQIATSPVSAPTGPGPILVNPAFDWVYVIEQSSFQISQYSFAPATGALSPLSPATISTGSGPVGGGITRDGNWAFIANSGASNLSALGVGTTGKLGPANTSTVILANQPSAILVR
jgi:6-phosphogluconolactonase (cycloisomerase 2 family)